MRSIGFIILAYAFLAAGFTLAGRKLARNFPGALMYLSHQSGPFSWNYTFLDGHVGPFQIGMSKKDLIKEVQHCGCFTFYPSTPGKQKMFVGRNEILEFSNESMSQHEILLSRGVLGGQVYYLLSLPKDNLTEVRVYSYLLGGL